ELIQSVTNVFFSSRRRHTSFARDWSSDVCSSDLVRRDLADAIAQDPVGQAPLAEEQALLVRVARVVDDELGAGAGAPGLGDLAEIGRASRRERLQVTEGAGAVTDDVVLVAGRAAR